MPVFARYNAHTFRMNFNKKVTDKIKKNDFKSVCFVKSKKNILVVFSKLENKKGFQPIVRSTKTFYTTIKNDLFELGNGIDSKGYYFRETAANRFWLVERHKVVHNKLTGTAFISTSILERELKRAA